MWEPLHAISTGDELPQAYIDMPWRSDKGKSWLEIAGFFVK